MGDTGRVLGLDGCRRGWVLAVVDVAGDTLTLQDLTVIGTVAEVPATDYIGIDIPIGLPESGTRAADVEARAALGRLRMSIFLTPARAAVSQQSRAEADVVNRARGGGGVTAQAYGLFAKIREVDDWLPRAPASVAEVHPELAFAELLGHLPNHSKKTWAGLHERLAALRAAGLDPTTFPQLDAAPDDVLDAVCCAWSAARCLAGTARAWPAKAEYDATGLPMQIRA